MNSKDWDFISYAIASEMATRLKHIAMYGDVFCQGASNMQLAQRWFDHMKEMPSDD